LDFTAGLAALAGVFLAAGFFTAAFAAGLLALAAGFAVRAGALDFAAGFLVLAAALG
jgi:hypothetical protein